MARFVGLDMPASSSTRTEQRVRIGEGDAEGDVIGLVIKLIFNGLYYGSLIENFIIGH